MQCNNAHDSGTIGNRIQLKRISNGLSLQMLSDLLHEQGVELGRAALSCYEVGRTCPSIETLDAIASALGTTRDFFFRSDSGNMDICFFKELDSQPSKISRLVAYVQICLEVYLDVQEELHINTQWIKPEQRCFSDRQECEIDRIALRVRQQSGCGKGPISSVCGILEDFHYILIPAQFLPAEIGALAGYDSVRKMPFIVYSTHLPTDDLRLALLTALGYVYIENENEMLRDLQALRFAYSFLLTPEQIRRELGENRTKVLTSELGLLKCKYGISRKCIAAWLKMLDGSQNQMIAANRTVTAGLSQMLGSSQEVLFFHEAPLKLLMLIEQCRARGIEVKDYISFMKYAVEIKNGIPMR